MNKKYVPDKSVGSEILPFLCLFHLKKQTRSFLCGVAGVFFSLNLLNATPGSVAATPERLATHCCFYLAMVLESFKL